jgi:hypothetical protein
MTEEQKQALIEWLKPQIDELQNVSDEIPFGLDSDSAMHLNTMRVALAALTAPPVKVDDSMALAFHKALNDGGVGHEDLEEIKVGLEAALCNITRPAPAADLADLVPPEADGSNLPFAANGWNSCRAAILRNIEKAR